MNATGVEENEPHRKIHPKQARGIAAELVRVLVAPEQTDDRMFCRRLSIVTPKRWTESMWLKFEELAETYRPNSVVTEKLFAEEELGPVPVADPYEDAKRVEREAMQVVRPFVRMTHDGVTWVGMQKGQDDHTIHVTRAFNVQFIATAMWLVDPRDARGIVEYAQSNGVAVTAGAAEYALSESHNGRLLVTQPSLPSMSQGRDMATSANGVPSSLVDGQQESPLAASPPPLAPEVEGQVSLFESHGVTGSPARPAPDPSGGDENGDRVVDYDGKDLIVEGLITGQDAMSHLRSIGMKWNGKDRRWELDPAAGEGLFSYASEVGWEITDSAREAHADALTEVALATQEMEIARERSRALVPTQNVVVPGLNPEFVPRPYQQAGIERAVELRRVIIADDVGLGKTLQALSSVAVAGTLPVIVVAKSSLKLNWHHEVTELFGWSTTIVEGRTREEIPIADVVIINPDLLKARLSDLLAVGAKALIVDESHFLSNPRSQRSKALRSLARPIRQDEGLVLSLTATLMPNGKAMEVYPQLDMLGMLGKNSPFASNWDSFGVKYAAGYQAYGRLVVDTPVDDPERGNMVRSGLLRLNADLETHCMVRRSKRDAQPDLPPAQVTPAYLDVDKRMWARYKQAERELAEFLAERAAEIAVEMGKDPYSASVRARLLLEHSNHEQLQSHNALSQLAVASKFAEMVEWVDTFLTDNPDEKLLIFAHNRAVQKALAGQPIPEHSDTSIQIIDWANALAKPVERAREVAEKFQVGTIFANADQSAESVEEDKARFQGDLNCRLMVLSLGAGSEGHTLTAAWHVAFAQLPMTAKTFRQAIGRAYGRLNDPHPVWVHPLLAGEEDTIDHDTLRRIARKGIALDAVQDGVMADADIALDLGDASQPQPGREGDDLSGALLSILDRHHGTPG